MESGLLIANGSRGGSFMVWTQKKRMAYVFPKPGEVVLSRKMFAASEFSAYKCDQCKKIVLDYADKEVEDEPNPVPCKWSDMNNIRPLPSEARERRKQP
jgi:hypothetical protein